MTVCPVITQGIRFALVGVIGFVIDAGLLWLLVREGGDPLLARCLTFPLAVLVTWYLNRIWSFGSSLKARPGPEVRNYFFVQVVGAFGNYAVYVAVLQFIEPTANNVLIAVAIGAIFGLAINFTGAKAFVFRQMAKGDRRCVSR